MTLREIVGDWFGFNQEIKELNRSRRNFMRWHAEGLEKREKLLKEIKLLKRRRLNEQG